MADLGGGLFGSGPFDGPATPASATVPASLLYGVAEVHVRIAGVLTGATDPDSAFASLNAAIEAWASTVIGGAL